MASNLSTSVTSSPTEVTKALTTQPSAETTILQVIATAAPSGTDSAVIAVVIVVICALSLCGFSAYGTCVTIKVRDGPPGEPARRRPRKTESFKQQAGGRERRKEYSSEDAAE
ncbi:hypothetical protein CgunFtcFv8_001253 [Champsocephalus gunnari]|uniref:Uncharacterized protein n=1 Tax=Champsocephalus gunnari TaxID=52237 RepID=A0AAN8HQY7_CHAGU|nr:hypothetical protein CgunFtcFv8_001253 [Champsocephalus gunnari]